MDRMNGELIGLGIIAVSSMVWMLLLLLRDKGLDRKESNLDDKLKNWADKYVDLKSEYLQVDAERAEWQRQYEEVQGKLDRLPEGCEDVADRFIEEGLLIVSLRKQLEEARKTLASSINERDKLADRLNELLDQISTNRERYHKLSADLTHWTSTATRTQGYLDLCRSDYEKLRAELNEVLLERDALKQKIELAEAKGKPPSFKEWRSENFPTKKEHQELKEEVARLQNQLAEANDANRSIVDNQVQVAENYEQRIAECQREIEAKEALYQAERETNRRLEGFIETYEREVLQLKTEKEHLAKAIENLKRVAVRREEWIAELERTNEILNAVDTRDETVKHLRDQLETVTASLNGIANVRDELRVQAFEAGQRANGLEEEVGRLQGELSACNNQNRELSVETERLKESVTLWQHRCAERDEQARQREERLAFDADPGKENTSLLLINGLQAELSSHREANNSLKNQLEDLEEKYDVVVAERDQLVKERGELAAALNSISEHRHKIAVKCNGLLAEKEQLLVANESLKNVNQGYANQLEHFEGTVRAMHAEKQQLLVENGGLIHAKQQLEKEREKTVNQLMQLDSEVRVLREGGLLLQNCQQKNADLQAQVEWLGKDRDQLKQHNKDLQTLMDRAAERRDLLESETGFQSKRIRDLQDDLHRLQMEAKPDFSEVCQPFRVDIDTKKVRESLDLTVRQCEKLKRAIVKANGGKTHEKRPMPKPNTINAMGPNDPPVTVQEVVDGISAGIDWGSIKPLPVRSLDLEEIDSTVDADGGSVGE